MFKKKENGFSLVELAVAAAIATALAVVAVSVVTGTATSVSEKGSSAAAAETCTISESLKGGTDETINDCGTATSGSQSNSNYTFTWDGASGGAYAALEVNSGGYGVSYFTVEGIGEAESIAIVDAINAGATTITIAGNTYPLGYSTSGFWHQANDASGHVYTTSSYYGGIRIIIFVDAGTANTEYWNSSAWPTVNVQ